MKRKSSHTRLIVFILGAVLFLTLAVAAFNYMVDPYGAFGDPLLNWWDYDITMNPRLAKYQYLRQHAEEYDSFLIGGSDSVDAPVEQLNTRFDAKFYICAAGDADISADEQLVSALMERQTVKNLILYLSPRMAVQHPTPELSCNNLQHFEVDGSSPLSYTLRYLFVNPVDSARKLYRAARKNSLQPSFQMFDAETGAYDRSFQNVEPISDLKAYLATGGRNAFEVQSSQEIRLSREALDRLLASVRRMKQHCAEKGIRFLVLCQPDYWKKLESLPDADLALFRNELAKITDYWDFSFTPFSYDPRFFYDPEQLRSCIGEKIFARVFQDSNASFPAEFGQYIPQGSSPGAPERDQPATEALEIRVPILMYHHLVADDVEGSNGVSKTNFEDQMKALSLAGYHTVSLDALRDWVELGTELPANPIVISFDDGYRSNYEIAFPILQRYDFQATIFAIGVSIGKEHYKDSDIPITPHFTLEEAAEMEASGLITVYSHGYDLHEVENLDPDPIRQGALQREDESEADYISFLQQDCAKMREVLGKQCIAFSYPYGFRSDLAELILSQQNVFATLTTEEHCNTLVRCLPQCLRSLGRLNVTDVSGAELVEKIQTAEQDNSGIQP